MGGRLPLQGPGGRHGQLALLVWDAIRRKSWTGKEGLCSQASSLSLLCLPCSSVLPNGFEMKAMARMEDAVSMATRLSTARQLQSRALRRRQMRRAATELPLACQ